MLVLSRKSGQRIQIGENITITIVAAKGSTVRIGIDAPADVRVLRSELANRPRAASGRAASPRYRPLSNDRWLSDDDSALALAGPDRDARVCLAGDGLRRR